jgi:hypothetical protein
VRESLERVVRECVWRVTPGSVVRVLLGRLTCNLVCVGGALPGAVVGCTAGG